MKHEIDGYDRLAIGVVELAAKDYRAVMKGLANDKSVYGRRLLLGAKAQIERFFKSEFGDVLCYGRAAEILDKLQKERYD